MGCTHARAATRAHTHTVMHAKTKQMNLLSLHLQTLHTSVSLMIISPL